MSSFGQLCCTSKSNAARSPTPTVSLKLRKQPTSRSNRTSLVTDNDFRQTLRRQPWRMRVGPDQRATSWFRSVFSAKRTNLGVIYRAISVFYTGRNARHKHCRGPSKLLEQLKIIARSLFSTFTLCKKGGTACRVKAWRPELLMDLVDVIQQTPGILHALPHDAQKHLQASCRRLRTLVHSNASTLLFCPATHTPATEARLLVKGDWRQLKRLSFRKAGLEPEAMAVLSQGDWPLLQYLNLALNKFGTRGMESFSLGAWPALESLQLNEVDMSAQMMCHLTHAHLPYLRFLNLSYNSMEACISSLTEGKWPQLMTLEISWAELDSACLAQLVRGVWPNLTKLNLSNNHISAASLGEFRNASWPLLANLNLQGSMLFNVLLRISEQEEQAFGEFAQCEWRYLQDLNLASCNIKPAMMHRLCQAQWENIKCLDLTANSLHGDCLKHLVESQWSQLRCLDMKWCDIDITAVSHLVQAQWPCLELLGLSGNDIHVEALEVIMQAKWTMLRLLDLSRNYLGPAAIVQLSRGTLLLKDGASKNVIDPPAWLLKQWPRLQKVDLSSCNIEF